MNPTCLFNTLLGYSDQWCSFGGSSWDVISVISVSTSGSLLCPSDITGSSSQALPLTIDNLGKFLFSKLLQYPVLHL